MQLKIGNIKDLLSQIDWQSIERRLYGKGRQADNQ
jgi:hypothetical protein